MKKALVIIAAVILLAAGSICYPLIVDSTLIYNQCTNELKVDTTKIATKYYSDANKPYLIYTALLTQSGTNPPVANVLENTLGGTVVWKYIDQGTYFGELTGAFSGDVLCMPIIGADASNYGVSAPYTVYKESDNEIGVSTYSDYSSGLGANNVLSGTSFIEIRVYNQ